MILSSLVRICELPYFKNAKDTDSLVLDNFFNAVWLIVMTVTTVGYGELHPYTFPGKIVCIISALWGATMISLLVLTTSTFFELEGKQLKAMKHINLTRNAANTISISFKYFLKKKQFYMELIKYRPDV